MHCVDGRVDLLGSGGHEVVKVRGLVFDLDDTLIPSTRIYEQAESDSCLDAKLLFVGRVLTKARLYVGHVAARNRLLYLKAGNDASGMVAASEIIRQMTLYEEALGELCRKAWVELQRDKLFFGLAESYKIAVLTNENTRTQLLKIASFAPDDRFFSVIVTSEEMGVEKPDSLVFAEVLSRLNFDADQCLMIGDDPVADLFPARDLGMHTVMTTEFAPSGLSSWDGDVIATLDSLPEFLESL